jgi:hypothetical protein
MSWEYILAIKDLAYCVAFRGNIDFWSLSCFPGLNELLMLYVTLNGRLSWLTWLIYLWCRLLRILIEYKGSFVVI